VYDADELLGVHVRIIKGAAVVAMAIMTLAGRPAFAGDQDSTIGLTFAEQRTAVPTEMDLHIVYRDPAHPDEKPSPIRPLEIDAPAGIRFDTTAVPACTATDAEIQALGRGACPADSRVGGGSLTAIEGFGPPIDPFVTDAVIFNGGDEIIETFTPPGAGGPVIAIDRIAISGSRLVGNPPALPGGPPDGQTAVREIACTFPAATRFVVTPPTCPHDREWRTSARFSFADGTTQAATSTTPCAIAASADHDAITGPEVMRTPPPPATNDLPTTGRSMPTAAAALMLLGALAVRGINRRTRRHVQREAHSP
jgi:hypothetical protein